MSNENETTPPAPPPPNYTFKEGDEIFIHANAGKYCAIVEKAFPNLRTAEEKYERSFQTITKKGPLYDKAAPHYLCFLNNPGENPIGACETDATLKAKT
jgi:hypothetical protein